MGYPSQLSACSAKDASATVRAAETSDPPAGQDETKTPRHTRMVIVSRDEERVNRHELVSEVLREADIEILEELDLSSALGRDGAYKVLVAADLEFLRLAAEASPGAAVLALLKIAVYENDGSTCVDAVELEKGVGQIRDSQLNDRGLELRKRLIKTVKRLERADTKS